MALKSYLIYQNELDSNNIKDEKHRLFLQSQADYWYNLFIEIDDDYIIRLLDSLT